MSVPRITRLQQLLEKFPRLRASLVEPTTSSQKRWATKLPQMDEALDGGLAQGALTEIVMGHKSSGSELLVRLLIDRAAQENQIVAMVDGNDSLDVAMMNESTLSRLLWIRCDNANKALKAVDLLLRDINISLVLLDLAVNPLVQLRRIPSTTWYRFQRLVEESSTVCVIFTPYALISASRERLSLRSRFSIEDLEIPVDELLHDLKIEASGAAQFQDTPAEEYA